jgi:hypothetical protein
MTYRITEAFIVSQPIANTEATQAADIPLGKIVRAIDPIYGEGEFIYLLGVASTVVGSVVTYDGASTGTPTYQTALAPSTANLATPLAVSMSANTAARYGWYQISGHAVTATNGTLAAGPGPVYLAGSGQVTSTGAAGKQVLNARNDTATGTPAANQAVVLIQRPFAQGAIT